MSDSAEIESMISMTCNNIDRNTLTHNKEKKNERNQLTQTIWENLSVHWVVDASRHSLIFGHETLFFLKDFFIYDIYISTYR